VIQKSDGKEWKFQSQKQTVGSICKALGDGEIYPTDVDSFTLGAEEVIPPGTYFTNSLAGLCIIFALKSIWMRTYFFL
jgi:hypothetical protein